MPDQTILIYATSWCVDCRRSKRFFDRHQIPYQWINIDQQPEAERFVLQTNNGLRSVPTIVFPDGTILVEPTDLQLAEKLRRSAS